MNFNSIINGNDFLKIMFSPQRILSVIININL